VNSPPPKPEVILTNFFAEPTVLPVPITSRVVLFYTIQLLNGKKGILCNFVDFSLIGENSRNIHVLLIY
jgi:hypothetical protein